MVMFLCPNTRTEPVVWFVLYQNFIIYSSESIAHYSLHSTPNLYQKPQSNISLLDRHHGQLAPHFSSFYLLNQRPHLLFTCYRPHHELFSARGKFTAPVFLQSGRNSGMERSKKERERRKLRARERCEARRGGQGTNVYR